MSKMLIDLPDTLRSQLEGLAQTEGISIDQYILFALARQATFAYTVRQLPEDKIADQKASFAGLLQKLGKASPEEIETIMSKRKKVPAEAGLAPEVVASLQRKIAKSRASA